MAENTCEGCAHSKFAGVRWPSEVHGDRSRDWIERCDLCERYPDDGAAARALVANGLIPGYGIGTTAGASGPLMQPFAIRPAPAW